MGPCNRSHRVSKVAPGKRKGRGRPQIYSESWKKKVVVLRACGLDLKDILDVLERQDGPAFKAKLRQSQQIVKALLADENTRFVPLEKRTARALAAFLRANRPRKAEQPFRGIISLHNAPTQSVADTLTLSTSDQSMPWSEFYHKIIETPQSEVDTEISTEYVASGSDTLIAHASLEPETAAVRSQIFNQDALHNSFTVGKHLMTKDQLRANIMRFSNDSFSSSLLSDLASVIRRRFSCSTLDTADRSSISKLSEPVRPSIDVTTSFTMEISTTKTEHITIESMVQSVLTNHFQESIRENSALIERCCFHSSSCLHKTVQELAANRLRPRNSFRSWDTFLNEYSEASPTMSNEDTQDILFFAARIGAPVEAVLHFWGEATDPRFVKKDGQTWLHWLDPQTLTGDSCVSLCESLSGHTSTFECVMNLTQLSSTIDCIDDHGRHCLIYLCSSSTFILSMLTQLVERYPLWAKRVSSVSQMRDRAGLFLWDYVSINPSFEVLNEDMRSLLYPKFDPSSLPSRLLQEEGPYGRTSFHFNIKKLSAQYSTMPHPNANQLFSPVNRYDDTGETPILTYVAHALNSLEQESTICENVKLLVSWGANVNARSRVGATILHYAAKRGAVKLLNLLLDELGARMDICDDKGYCVTNHIAKSVKASYSANRSADFFARSIKAAGKLLALQQDQSAKSGRRSIRSKPSLQEEIIGEVPVSVIMMVDNRELKRTAVALFDLAYHPDIVSTHFLRNYPNLVYLTFPEETTEPIYGRKVLQAMGTIDLRWYGRNSELPSSNNVLRFQERFSPSTCKVVDSDEFDLIIGRETIDMLQLINPKRVFSQKIRDLAL